MTPERLQQIERIRHEALGYDPKQRSIFLGEACAGDHELRAAVESRLTLSLGHYEIVSRIGAGGMGEVYLARDNSLERQVALKVLLPQLSRDSQWLGRFIREAKAASALNHPNILTIYEIGQAGESHYIASEYVEGETLRQRIDRGRFSLDETLRIAVQAAAALEAAHSARVVHRDIKPENIMVRPDGLVKVLDFGLARLSEPQSTSHDNPTMTQSAIIMGTPRYMSPEQARGERVDAGTDIFSLGAVLYEMLSGEPAFLGTNLADVFVSLLAKEPVPLNTHVSNLPGGLESVLRKALAKDRTQRYASMQEFLAELEQIKESGPARPATKIESTSVALSRRMFVPAAVIAVAGAGYGSYKWVRSGHSPGSAGIEVRILPVTSTPGDKDSPCFSPDGSQIAFVWNGGKSQPRSVYIKVVGAGEPLRLTASNYSEDLPAWSHDGRYIAFVRNLQEGSAVFVVPALGGQERKVCDSGFGVSWFPDGKRLAIASAAPPADSGGISILALETGERRKLTEPGQYIDHRPAVSPDGEFIAFIRRITGPQRELFVVPARGGAPRQLTFDRRPVMGHTWTSNSKELVFSVNRGGGQSLWRIRSQGGTPERVILNSPSATSPSISRQGDRLVYTEAWSDTNIWRSEGPGFGSGDAPGPFGPAECFVCSSRDDHSICFAPDGRRIAFVSARTGSEEIWVANSDGTRPVQLTSIDGAATGSPSWSPDGRWIAFDSRQQGKADIFVISSEGGTPRLLTPEPSHNAIPSWSQDGRHVYFSSNRGTGPQMWKKPVEGGDAVQVTRSVANLCFESFDGRWLYFSKGRGVLGIWYMPVAGGEEKRLDEIDKGIYGRAWGLMKQGIFFIAPGAERCTVYFFSFATRRVTPLLTLDKWPLSDRPTLAISPDGRTLLHVRLDHDVADIMLIENFR